MNIIVYLAVILKNSIYGASVFFTGSLSNSMDEFDILSLRFLMSFVVLWVLKSLHVIKISVKLKELVGFSERKSHIKNLMLTALFELIHFIDHSENTSDRSGIRVWPEVSVTVTPESPRADYSRVILICSHFNERI